MREFRRLAARIDQHMQQLAAQGVHEAHAVINRMICYLPDLQEIWLGSSDQQLMAISHEFPGFYRYAIMTEEASEAESKEASRPYDGLVEFSDEHKQKVSQLLKTAAGLERGYQAYQGSLGLPVFRPQLNDLTMLHRKWLADLDLFKNSLPAQSADPQAMEYVNEAFSRTHRATCRLIVSSATEISRVPAYNPLLVAPEGLDIFLGVWLT